MYLILHNIGQNEYHLFFHTQELNHFQGRNYDNTSRDVFPLNILSFSLKKALHFGEHPRNISLGDRALAASAAVSVKN